jgi:hypothetical protein
MFVGVAYMNGDGKRISEHLSAVPLLFKGIGEKMIKNLLMKLWVKSCKRADRYRALIACLAFATLLCGGCASIQEAWMKAYVAVHDAADAALSNKPPVVVSSTSSNVPSVQVETGPSVTTSLASCGCDLSTPACAAYEDVRQITIRNSHWEECGLESKYKILMRPVVTFGGHIITVSSILEGSIKAVDGGYEVACPIKKLGYSWHILGYSLGDDHLDKMQVRFKKGDKIFIPRDGKRAFVFVEGRK